MGQKVHPIGFRLGIIKTWDSRWFSQKNYATLLVIMTPHVIRGTQAAGHSPMLHVERGPAQ